MVRFAQGRTGSAGCWLGVGTTPAEGAIALWVLGRLSSTFGNSAPKTKTLVNRLDRGVYEVSRRPQNTAPKDDRGPVVRTVETSMLRGVWNDIRCDFSQSDWRMVRLWSYPHGDDSVARGHSDKARCGIRCRSRAERREPNERRPSDHPLVRPHGYSDCLLVHSSSAFTRASCASL